MTCCQVKSIAKASITKGTRTNNQIHECQKRTISSKEEEKKLNEGTSGKSETTVYMFNLQNLYPTFLPSLVPPRWLTDY